MDPSRDLFIQSIRLNIERGSVSPRPYKLGQRQLAADQTRSRILKAARELLADENGLASFTIDAVARLQLARALAASEDNTAGARAAYQDFLTLWKQADTDVPLLKQAQTEAATLR